MQNSRSKKDFGKKENPTKGILGKFWRKLYLASQLS